MCNLFLAVDPGGYVLETRAVRLHGHVTSIRLEAVYWATLEEIARVEELSLARFITTLQDEILAKHGEVPNFASLLRVTCLQYLRFPALHTEQVARRLADAERARDGMSDVAA